MVALYCTSPFLSPFCPSPHSLPLSFPLSLSLPRADLVAYYEELSREAERRKMRAEWQARRLNLNQERQQFLQQERDKLEREVEAKREEVFSERTQEVEESVETSGGELGDDERRRKPRRMWVEGVATPGGHQGRKTWVASLIEAPAAQIGDRLPSPTAISPVEEFQTPRLAPPSGQQQLPSGQQQLPSVAEAHSREQRLEGGMEPEIEDGVEPGLESGVEPEVEGSMEPGLDGGLEPGLEGEIKPTQITDTELGHQGQVTPIRVCEPPSIAQHVIYGRELERPEQLERLQLQEKATHSTPREDSSRGQGPPSTAQDIIYARATAAHQDAGLTSTRGHAPSSTVQDIMYTQEGNSLVRESTRGRAPLSVIQDLMYPRDLSHVPFVSTRGTPPPSSIQQLMYPVKDKEEKRTSQRVREKEEKQTFPVFQPYQDSYPMLGELAEN